MLNVTGLNTTIKYRKPEEVPSAWKDGLRRRKGGKEVSDGGESAISCTSKIDRKCVRNVLATTGEIKKHVVDAVSKAASLSFFQDPSSRQGMQSFLSFVDGVSSDCSELYTAMSDAGTVVTKSMKSLGQDALDLAFTPEQQRGMAKDFAEVGQASITTYEQFTESVAALGFTGDRLAKVNRIASKAAKTVLAPNPLTVLSLVDELWDADVFPKPDFMSRDDFKQAVTAGGLVIAFSSGGVLGLLNGVLRMGMSMLAANSTKAVVNTIFTDELLAENPTLLGLRDSFNKNVVDEWVPVAMLYSMQSPEEKESLSSMMQLPSQEALFNFLFSAASAGTMIFVLNRLLTSKNKSFTSIGLSMLGVVLLGQQASAAPVPHREVRSDDGAVHPDCDISERSPRLLAEELCVDGAHQGTAYDRDRVVQACYDAFVGGTTPEPDLSGSGDLSNEEMISAIRASLSVMSTSDISSIITPLFTSGFNANVFSCASGYEFTDAFNAGCQAFGVSADAVSANRDELERIIADGFDTSGLAAGANSTRIANGMMDDMFAQAQAQYPSESEDQIWNRVLNNILATLNDVGGTCVAPELQEWVRFTTPTSTATSSPSTTPSTTFTVTPTSTVTVTPTTTQTTSPSTSPTTSGTTTYTVTVITTPTSTASSTPTSTPTLTMTTTGTSSVTTTATSSGTTTHTSTDTTSGTTTVTITPTSTQTTSATTSHTTSQTTSQTTTATFEVTGTNDGVPEFTFTSTGTSTVTTTMTTTPTTTEASEETTTEPKSSDKISQTSMGLAIGGSLLLLLILLLLIRKCCGSSSKSGSAKISSDNPAFNSGLADTKL